MNFLRSRLSVANFIGLYHWFSRVMSLDSINIDTETVCTITKH